MLRAILKPTPLKFIVALALFALTNVAQAAWWNANVADLWRYGFPFPFYETWGPCPSGEVCRAFRWPTLVADLAIWYAVSAAIIGLVQSVWGSDAN